MSISNLAYQKKLDKLKEDLRGILVDKSFQGIPEVLRKVEEHKGIYDFIPSKIIFHRNAYEQAVNNKDDIVSQVESFIDSIALINNGSIEQYNLYQYYIKYSEDLCNEIGEHFETNKTKINIILVSGISKYIDSIKKEGGKYKYVWLIEHLIPSFLEYLKVSTRIVNIASTKGCNDENLLLEHLINCYELPLEYRDIDENNIEEAIKALCNEILLMLNDTYVFVPIFVESTRPNFQGVSTFLNEYITKISNYILDNQPNYPLVFLVLFDDNSKCEDYFKQIKEYHKTLNVPAIDKVKCDRWVSQRMGGFFKENETLATNFLDKYKHPTENYIPVCNSKEGLFEKITKDIFDMEFKDFLRKNTKQLIQ